MPVSYSHPPGQFGERRKGCGCSTWVFGALGLFALLYLVVVITAKRVERVVQIDAPADLIWDNLVDFEGYANWNPNVAWVVGSPVEGTELSVGLQFRDWDPMEVSATVTKADIDHELSWSGGLPLPWIFDDEHSIRIVPLRRGGGCRVLHTARFRGLGPAFLWWRVGSEAGDGIDSHNAKLKSKSEQMAVELGSFEVNY